MNLEIVENKQLRPGIFLMSLKHSGALSPAAPGQFLHIRCTELSDPLLRRPFSVYYMDAETVEILYKVSGKGTALLSRRKAGEAADVIGPLGRGFNISPAPGSALIVAGGMGIAPLCFLASKLGGRVKKFIAACASADSLLCASEIGRLGLSLETATEDGTCGFRGTACSLLELSLRQVSVSDVYACGPEAMLEAVAMICKKFTIRCQLSFESRMACGVGACLGCAIRIREGGGLVYRRVCRDGPVFMGEQVAWENRT